MTLSYDLSKHVGNTISIMITYDVELIGEIVETNIQSGKLLMKNIRLINPNDGSLVKWAYSVEDTTPIDIGLSQNKIFMEPSSTMLTEYRAIFPIN